VPKPSAPTTRPPRTISDVALTRLRIVAPDASACLPRIGLMRSPKILIEPALQRPAALVLRDRQAPALHAPHLLVELGGHAQRQVVAHDADGVALDVAQERLRRLALVQVRVQRADAGGKASAAVDVRLLHHDDVELRRALARLDRRHAAGRAAADDQQIAAALDDSSAHRCVSVDSRKSFVPGTCTQSLVSAS
jgi:hypothetical protein